MKKNISLVLFSFVLISSGIAFGAEEYRQRATELKTRMLEKKARAQHKMDFLKARAKRVFGKGEKPVITQKTKWKKQANPYQAEYDKERGLLDKAKDKLFGKSTSPEATGRKWYQIWK